MKKIFLIIGIVLLSVFGISIFQEFMANHTYYGSMLASWTNWKIIIWGMVAASIPLLYLVRAKTFSLKKFFLYILPIGLLLFSISHTLIKDSIVGGTAGFFVLCFNTLFLYFLGMFFVLGALSLGTWISKTFVHFREIRRQELLISFGLGIGAILLIFYVLSMTTLLWPLITWIIAIGLGVLIRYMKKDTRLYIEIISPLFSSFSRTALKHVPRKWVGLLLIGIVLMYYFYGFNLSFIPYSTAWDANHEYMYIPKVLAENHGVLWGNMGPASSAPYLWHLFITFRYSLIQPIKSWFWLAPDTIAVAMNFLSGIFAFVFGLGLVKEVVSFFGKKHDEEESLSVGFGWTGLLLWLTSGMGAFLVFVDNKTDLGVMAMTILALLSGFILLRAVAQYTSTDEHRVEKHAIKYVIMSGIFFALASMAKPTAFVDIALFGLLLVGLRIDEIIALGLGVMVVGATGVLQVLNAKDIMNTQLGMWVLGIGAFIVVLGILLMVRKRSFKIFSKKSHYLKYIGIWIATLLAVLLVFKGPNIIGKHIQNDTLNPINFVKSLLLGKQDSPRSMFATNTSQDEINKQNTVDQSALDDSTKNISLDGCKVQEFSDESLKKNLKTAVSTNEDVGRYVGYGRKDITRGNGLSVGYYLVRLFFPANNICYGLNSEAKLLCTHAYAINSFDVASLQDMFQKTSEGSQAWTLLSGALSAAQAKKGARIDPNEFRDEIVALRQYYQNHAIYTEAGKISIPYRYIIPFNVVFNWSLQNLSSYYTDIGFIRLFMFGFIIMALIYALIKREQALSVLAGTTIIGRSIWWIIGGGIVWYGIGLIMWTILTVSLFLKTLFSDKDNESPAITNLGYVFMGLLALRVVIQFFLNFIRISSQGGSGPFLRYKMNYGKSVEVTDQLQQKEIIQNPYGWKDVFDLQFPHYNAFINHTANRADTDGVLIAGTYIQYFLKNQRNITFDGMLNRFREQTSDDNECKSYKRLQKNNIKYLVIDPNIGTVVMGEGNESLFYRFFAKLDPVTKKIQEHGALSRLVQLWKDGYISLFSTNNLGAKYAFGVSDAALQQYFGTMDADGLILLRAKLAIARFFPEEVNRYVDFIAQTFTQRLSNGEAISDIANVYGKQIDEAKVMEAAVTLLQQKDPTQSQSLIASLSQDERLILLQYLGLVNLANTQNSQYAEYLNNLLSQSLAGGSQLIVFSLN